jgi:hypothetical protein
MYRPKEESSSFLKKRTKKLFSIRYAFPGDGPSGNKSFLVLFFKKEPLPFSGGKKP